MRKQIKSKVDYAGIGTEVATAMEDSISKLNIKTKLDTSSFGGAVQVEHITEAQARALIVESSTTEGATLGNNPAIGAVIKKVIAWVLIAFGWIKTNKYTKIEIDLALWYVLVILDPEGKNIFSIKRKKVVEKAKSNASKENESKEGAKGKEA